MARTDCCPCCNNNISLDDALKSQYQLLSIKDETAELSIFPNGNTVELCPSVKGCETLTTVDAFRLVGGYLLEIVYRGEDDIPISKTVDLSTLTVEATPFDILDTNTVDLVLNGIILSASVKIDPASTAPVSASADGIRIDCCGSTPNTATSTDAITVTATGVDNRNISASLRYTDTTTVDLNVGGTGLVAAVKISNDPRQLITVTDGLFVNEDDIIALVNNAQTVDVEAPLSYDAINNIISIDAADNLTDGYLSSVDWIRFDAKVPPIRTITTTLPLQGGGDLSVDRTFSILQGNSTTNGYISSIDWNTFNSKLSPSRVINTTGPITGGGPLTADLTIAMPAATSLVNGYLTSLDWTTFNSKINTALNVGTGGAIFKQKNGFNNLELRTVTGSTGQIVITQGADTINVAIDPGYTTGTGTPSNLIVKDEGSVLTSGAISVNFVGTGVTATQAAGDVTVTIPGLSTTIATATYVDGNYTANIADADKVVFLKATTTNVNYTINPTTFSGRKIMLYTMNTAPFIVTLIASSGTILDNLSYAPANKECVTIYSNGSDLFSIAKN